MERMTDRARGIIPLVAVTFGVVVLLLAVMVFVRSAGFGYDYAAYDAAARRLVDGAPLYLADTGARYAAGAYEGLYLYPPPLAIAITPFTLLTSADATVAWLLLRMGVLIGSCAILPVSRTSRALTFASACLSFPVLFDLNIGNVSLVVLGLSAVAWRSAGSAMAAVAHAALVAIRFPFGVYYVLWLARRRWRPVVLTTVAGIGLIALSLPIVGLGTYGDYVTILRGLPDISTGPHNLSLKSTALDLGVGDPLAPVLNIVGFAIGALAVIYAARRRDDDVAFVVTAISTLLVTPFIHPHYLVLLLLPAALLMHRGHPWAFVLPLAGWLPEPLLPLIAPVVLVLLLAVHEPPRTTDPTSTTETQAVPATLT